MFVLLSWEFLFGIAAGLNIWILAKVVDGLMEKNGVKSYQKKYQNDDCKRV